MQRGALDIYLMPFSFLLLILLKIKLIHFYGLIIHITAYSYEFVVLGFMAKTAKTWAVKLLTELVDEGIIKREGKSVSTIYKSVH